jgi:transposase-like protein
MRYTVKQFRADFPNDDVCLETIFKERYGDVDVCPRCGVMDAKFYRVRGRKCYACKDCSYQLHPLAETIFHKSSTPLTDWFYAIYLFSVSKNGVAAKELERHLGVTYKTAHRMARQIRSLMDQDGQIGGFGGIVEADETYHGGVKKNGKSVRGKTPILGVVERNGEVRSIVSDVASTSRAKRFITENVKSDSVLHTDESRIYLWTKKYGIEHESVNHSVREYARGKVTTNTIEGFWGQMKRSIDGTYHCVSPKYLQLYVNEFVFRYNLRGAVVYPALLELAARRVG